MHDETEHEGLAGRRTLARVSEVDPRAAELIELELGSELDSAYHT